MQIVKKILNKFLKISYFASVKNFQLDKIKVLFYE